MDHFLVWEFDAASWDQGIELGCGNEHEKHFNQER
jgi:hypothetical protein